MSRDARELDDLLRRAEAGDRQVLGNAFAVHADRLRQAVRLRMDRRLRARLDPSDVVQEACIEATERFEEFQRQPELSFYLWLRYLTLQKLLILHRHHLGTKARDAGRDLSLGALPEASSADLAAKLVGHLSTPSQLAMRAELQRRIRDVLDRLEPTDREILALRHFEQLTNGETAKVLGLRESTTSMRYARALLRLKDILAAEQPSRD